MLIEFDGSDVVLERDIEKHLVRRVQEAGGKAYKFVSPQNRGVSDRIVVLPSGVVWFVELKAPGGKLSPLQVLFGEEVKKMNGNYTVLWSKEDVDAFVATVSE